MVGAVLLGVSPAAHALIGDSESWGTARPGRFVNVPDWLTTFPNPLTDALVRFILKRVSTATGFGNVVHPLVRAVRRVQSRPGTVRLVKATIRKFSATLGNPSLGGTSLKEMLSSSGLCGGILCVMGIGVQILTGQRVWVLGYWSGDVTCWYWGAKREASADGRSGRVMTSWWLPS